MFILYDIIFTLFAIAYVPYLVVSGKWHDGFWARLGRIPAQAEAALQRKKNIWVHAVSVGEVMSVAGLLQRLKASFPDHQIVLSTVTITGYTLAASKFSKDCAVIYAPLDLSWVVRRYVALIRPKIYIAAETEIWPNLFGCLEKNGIPIVQVNGRMSERAFGRYKAVRFLSRKVLDGVAKFCMQSQTDADRILALGVSKEKVAVVGNLKFDDQPQSANFTSGDIGFGAKSAVWVAGSTHPGEEKIVLDILKSLSGEFPELRLVIAPRHIERTKEVLGLVGSSGFQPVRFSQPKQAAMNQNSVVVVDTIGQLRSLYSLARVVFVGKSLTVGGGHNIIEPAFYAKPVLIGPQMQNFRDIVDLFLAEKAVIQVKDADELLNEMRRLLKDPPRQEALGRLAQSVVRKYQGATEKTLKTISGLMAST